MAADTPINSESKKGYVLKVNGVEIPTDHQSLTAGATSDSRSRTQRDRGKA